MPPKKMHALAVIAIIAFGAFAYVQQIPAQGWVSDDYAEVFNNGVTPYMGFSRTLKLCGWGHYTVARLLGLPFKLYVGCWLGPLGSHYLQAGLHIACALVFWRLLVRLDFPLFTSTLAAVIFVVSPWLSEAPIWWATMITPASTLCILLAAWLYVRMIRGEIQRGVALCMACLLVLASLSFYELWLVAPVLFVSIDLYFNLTRSDETLDGSAFWRCLRTAMLRCWPIIAVVLLWSVAYKLTQFNPVRAGEIVPRRVLPVIASIHLRVVSWITRTPWRTALRDGVRYAGAWWIVLLGAGLSLFAVANNADQIKPATRQGRQLFLRACLAWGFFLASRLVFVFMTGIGFNSRHNYGAAMGVALLLSCVMEYLIFTRGRRAARIMVAALLVLSLSALAITSAGIRHHYVATSQAERATVAMLSPIAAKLPPDDSILVIGPATNTQGELGYFSEQTGQWLEKLLQQVNPKIRAYVVSSADFTNDDVDIFVTERSDASYRLRLDLRHVRIFKWSDGGLLEAARNPGDRK